MPMPITRFEIGGLCFFLYDMKFLLNEYFFIIKEEPIEMFSLVT